jgi:hypothetical protein
MGKQERRAYHSNDNAHVERKNCSCVRQLFGYDRMSDARMVKLMNDLYAAESVRYSEANSA